MDIQIKEGCQRVNIKEEIEQFFFCSKCGKRQGLYKIHNGTFQCKFCQMSFTLNETGEATDTRGKSITIEKNHLVVFSCPRCLDYQPASITQDETLISCRRCGTYITKKDTVWYGVERDYRTGEFVTPLPGEWQGKLR